MFDRSRVVLLTAFLVASTATAAAAQDAHQRERVDLRERMDSIEPLLRTLHVSDSIYNDSVRKANEPKRRVQELDSAMAGPFKVVGLKGNVSRSKESAQAAWSTMRPLFGNMEDAAQGVVFVVESGGIPGNLAKHVTDTSIRVTLLSDRHDLWRNAYESAMGSVLTTRLAPSIRAWLGTGTLGPQSFDQTFRSLMLGSRRDTVYSAKPARCALKNMPVCRRLLGFDSLPGDLPNQLVRTSFISYVVRQVPAGSIASSTADTADVISAIEHIGGKPIDALIVEWRTYVSDNRPQGFQDFGRNVVVTIAWMAAFAALAMRSTRWRLG